MNDGTWLGLGLGAVIGLIYGYWQRRAMGAGPKPEGAGRAFTVAVIRLTALMVAVYIAIRFTDANRLWLVGGVMAAYGIMFTGTMLRTMLKKK
jgi:hydrogenase/urease accessory protein HupE